MMRGGGELEVGQFWFAGPVDELRVGATVVGQLPLADWVSSGLPLT